MWSVSFSPCGTYLASTGDDLSLKIWKRIELATEMGNAGEARREEGGLMGPWSRSGVRIGQKERFEWREVSKLEGIHDRSVYSLDWQRGGVDEKEGGLGRIATCAGDGKIRIWQVVSVVLFDVAASRSGSNFRALLQTRPESNEAGAPPQLTSLATLEDAHGLSDINSIKWCTLSPSKAAATLRSLEGGEEDEERQAENDDEAELDTRWKGCEDWFATAGDDGLIKVWKLEEESSEGSVDAMQE